MIVVHPVRPVVPPKLLRRSLLGSALVIAALPTQYGVADTAPADAVTTIQRFSDALLGTMKSGSQSDIGGRFQALAPEMDRAFDLLFILATSVGPSWAILSSGQRSRLQEAFRCYSVVSYLSSFATYDGQSFIVSPVIRSLDDGQVVVQSHIVPKQGSPTELGYVMRSGSAGWKTIDVLAAGSISRVATQRSDFRRVLANGGGDALLTSLQRKTSDLSGGAR